MLKHATPPYVDARLGQYEEPDWEPLERLADDDPDVLGGFMWMNSIRLADGRELQAYKHCDTRRYLRLDDDLVAYAAHPDHDCDAYRPTTYAEALPPVFDFDGLAHIPAELQAGAQRLLDRLGLQPGRREDSI